MSLRVIRTGLLDTVQDAGRNGFRHLGVNPSGAMDRISAQIANALLGKELNAPVIELHFPASVFSVEKPCLLCICGADFTASVNGVPVPLHHPLALNAGTVLSFEKHVKGARAYLAFRPELQLTPWLKSVSTNLKAGAGGLNGRSLKKDDVLMFSGNERPAAGLLRGDFTLLPWTTSDTIEWRTEIEYILGSEWHWLSAASKENFQQGYFQVTQGSDRMGFRLSGPQLDTVSHESVLSSGVDFGTIQLLPNGQLVVLMADHQTIGGYPRIAHVISAHLPLLAQKEPGEVIRFRQTDLATAEKKRVKQERYLQQLQIASKFKVERFLDAAT